MHYRHAAHTWLVYPEWVAACVSKWASAFVKVHVGVQLPSTALNCYKLPTAASTARNSFQLPNHSSWPQVVQ